tara:strand:+ start:333 stop:1040 length:708 start_codon:yes stop_codon:yes gene_type:complete
VKKFIFDVDGTLTSSRCQIDPDFRAFMLKFSWENDVYLVTGSDRQKTLEQVGEDLYNRSKRVYNCSGSDVYEGDENVYRSDWELPWDVERFLDDELDYSSFPIRNGNHIERRPGGVNFSILGRASDPFLGRKEYMEWNERTDERAVIADRLRRSFPGLSIALGGQTGLDIGPYGSDKSQILRDFSKDDKLHFFGDRMEKGGNDYSLAEAVKKWDGYPHHVRDWKETRTILEGIHD